MKTAIHIFCELYFSVCCNCVHKYACVIDVDVFKVKHKKHFD